jgi:hypothetical protein
LFTHHRCHCSCLKGNKEWNQDENSTQMRYPGGRMHAHNHTILSLTTSPSVNLSLNAVVVVYCPYYTHHDQINHFVWPRFRHSETSSTRRNGFGSCYKDIPCSVTL